MSSSRFLDNFPGSLGRWRDDGLLSCVCRRQPRVSSAPRLRWCHESESKNPALRLRVHLQVQQLRGCVAGG